MVYGVIRSNRLQFEYNRTQEERRITQNIKVGGKISTEKRNEKTEKNTMKKRWGLGGGGGRKQNKTKTRKKEEGMGNARFWTSEVEGNNQELYPSPRMFSYLATCDIYLNTGLLYSG